MTCLMSNECLGLHFIVHVDPCINDVCVLVILNLKVFISSFLDFYELLINIIT